MTSSTSQQAEQQDGKPTKYSEPDYAKSDKAKTDFPWYLKSIDKYLLPEVSRPLLDSCCSSSSPTAKNIGAFNFCMTECSIGSLMQLLCNLWETMLLIAIYDP